MISSVDWFSNPGNAAFAAFFISLISVFVAAAAMYTSWKTQKRQVEIEEIREKDRQNEMRKADLVARLVKDGRDLLIIENKGPAEAREISIHLNDRPISEFPAFVRDQSEIHRVGPYSSFHYLMAFYSGVDLTPEITINWIDDSEEPGIYQTTLTY
jgi:hypothetical protein